MTVGDSRVAEHEKTPLSEYATYGCLVPSGWPPMIAPADVGRTATSTAARAAKANLKRMNCPLSRGLRPRPRFTTRSDSASIADPRSKIADPRSNRKSRGLRSGTARCSRPSCLPMTESVNGRRLNRAWFLPPVLAVLVFVHSPATLVVAGLISIVWGALVALNYRGAAERMPPILGRSMLSWDGSVSSTRKTFAALAVGGVFMILAALPH